MFRRGFRDHLSQPFHFYRQSNQDQKTKHQSQNVVRTSFLFENDSRVSEKMSLNFY